MEKKSYKITFSLQEGYEAGSTIHDIRDAERVIREWLTMRIKSKQPIINGLLQQGTLFFPSKNGDELITVSPTAIYTGELTEPADFERPDTEVKQTLESLAIMLKEKLRQEAVYINYLNTIWCI